MLIPTPDELAGWSTPDLEALKIHMPIETDGDWLVIEAICIELHRRDPEKHIYPTIREHRGIAPK